MTCKADFTTGKQAIPVVLRKSLSPLAVLKKKKSQRIAVVHKSISQTIRYFLPGKNKISIYLKHLHFKLKSNELKCHLTNKKL